jgi:hypothetical protein
MRKTRGVCKSERGRRPGRGEFAGTQRHRAGWKATLRDVEGRGGERRPLRQTVDVLAAQERPQGVSGLNRFVRSGLLCARLKETFRYSKAPCDSLGEEK